MHKFTSLLFIRLTLIFLFFILTNLSFGQIRSIEISVNGLTCAQCSRHVEKSLEKLTFVKSIVMDLQNTTASLGVKDGEEIQISKIKTAIDDAGFSIGKMTAMVDFSADRLAVGMIQFFPTYTLYVVQCSTKNSSKPTKVQFVDADFVDKKEFKKWNSIIPTAIPDSLINVYCIAL
jgi:copper chaperone CopZ